jgi:hypothetical protein
VATLLWVLTEEGGDDPQAGPLIPNGIPTCTLYGIPLWVDTEEELGALQELAEDYERDRTLVQDVAKALEVEPKNLLLQLQKTLEESTLRKDLLEAAEGREQTLQGDLDLIKESERVLREENDELKAKAPTPVEGSLATAVEYRPWWRRWF